MALNKAERLQLQAAADRLDAIYASVPPELITDIAYVAARLEKVLTGHAAYR
jgi:hypothetical protein